MSDGEEVSEVTADLERRFLPAIVAELDAMIERVLAARDRLPQKFPELENGEHSQPAILHGDLGIVAGAIEEATARARTALSAATAFRVAVAVVYRALKIENWVRFCRLSREGELASDTGEEPYFLCWRKLADFSDRMPEATEEELRSLLEPSELRAFLRFYYDGAADMELVIAATELFEEFLDGE